MFSLRRTRGCYTLTRYLNIRNLSIRPMERIPIPKKMEIHLTDSENELCTLLDGCTKWMKEEKGVETSCRIAGGWVRDKLLGSDSNDIDVALTDMMGLPFAEQFQQYCNDVKGLPVEKVAKIEKNPARSKHLETAKTTVLGVELDFVNLRSEEYAEDSRIPTQVEFGTPLQDAIRRDITINALFYNVHSRSVEDHTEKGLEDLINGTIRTPLPPRETFMDDPLRVIRCIRFASRFGFSFVEELQAAARDPEIQLALRTKISRERVGEELDKMMKGRDPLRAIQLIDELSLYTSIFHVPDDAAPAFSCPIASPHVGLAAASILHILTNPSSVPDLCLPSLHPLLSSSVVHDQTTLHRLYLAAALTPYRSVTYTHKNRIHLAVEAAIRDGVKLGIQNHYLDGIPALFQAADLLESPRIGGERERQTMGLLMREKSVHNPNTGSFWASSFLFSLVQELVPFWDPIKGGLDAEEASKRIGLYNRFMSRAEELALPDTVDAKPILDGREVVRILGASKPGPWTGHVLSRVVEWQLDQTEGTKAQCEEWLKAEHVAGRVNFEVTPAFQVKRGRQDSQGSNMKKVKTDDWN